MESDKKLPGAPEGSLKRTPSSSSNQEQIDLLNNAAVELLRHRETTLSSQGTVSSVAAASYSGNKRPRPVESSSAGSQESFYFLPRMSVQQLPTTVTSLTWPISSSNPSSSTPSTTGLMDSDSTYTSSNRDASLFTPLTIREYDILFGRGKTHRRHPGNMRLQLISDLYRDTYINSDREEKTAITKNMVQILKSGSKAGRFLKLDPVLGQWVEVSDEVARAKVGHAIRDGKTTSLENLDLSVLDDFPGLPERIKQAIASRAKPSTNKVHAYHTFGKEEAAMIIEIFAKSSSQQQQSTEESDAKEPVREEI